MELSIEIAIFLFFIAGIAGAIDAIAGGGGLLTVPALLSVGLPPTQALATNKLQGSFACLSSSLYFIKNGLINLKEMRFVIFCTFLGSAIASQLIQIINIDFLNGLIPVLLICISLYFLLAPPINNLSGSAKISDFTFAFFIGASIGFYDGFFGPGAGALYMVAYVTIMRFTMVEATARTKILNLVSNVTALMFFIMADLVIWPLGLVMAVGSFIGARMGAKVVLTKGTKFIRPMVITMSLLMALKLLWEQYLL